MRPLPPDTHNMVKVWTDMEHDMKEEVGEVPDGLHYQDRPPSVPECIHTGPQRIQRGGGGGVGG